MRRLRIHIPNQMYYLVGRSNGTQPLFRDCVDYECFKQTLGRAARTCRATVYAFCLCPASFHLAVRISNVPTGRLMASLARTYVDAFHRRHSDHGALLHPHHHALLVDGEYLPELVRFIVWLSVRVGCASKPYEWEYSSHAAYLDSTRMPWVDSATVLKRFDPDVRAARRRYEKFIATPTSDWYAQGFEHGLPGEPRVFGSVAFLRCLGIDVRPAVSQSLQVAIQSICLYCGITEEEMSSQRRLAYARALTAWYVEERNMGSLAMVARYFGRHWSTLRSGIRVHQAKSPALFDADGIHGARPLLEMSGAPAAASRSYEAPEVWWRHSTHSIRACQPLRVEQLSVPTRVRRRRRPVDGE